MAESVITPVGPPAELRRLPLVANNRSFGWISDRVASIAEGRTPVWWWLAFVPSALAAGFLFAMLAYQISTGVGVWGECPPGHVGLGHHQFRLVDRHRPRRDPDLGDSCSCCVSAGARL